LCFTVGADDVKCKGSKIANAIQLYSQNMYRQIRNNSGGEILHGYELDDDDNRCVGINCDQYYIDYDAIDYILNIYDRDLLDRIDNMVHTRKIRAVIF
jgi:hypothetical protein